MPCGTFGPQRDAAELDLQARDRTHWTQDHEGLVTGGLARHLMSARQTLGVARGPGLASPTGVAFTKPSRTSQHQPGLGSTGLTRSLVLHAQTHRPRPKKINKNGRPRSSKPVRSRNWAWWVRFPSASAKPVTCGATSRGLHQRGGSGPRTTSSCPHVPLRSSRTAPCQAALGRGTSCTIDPQGANRDRAPVHR